MPDQSPAKTTKLKCLVLGATSAGKTSLIRKYFYDKFDESRVATLGSDWYTKTIPNPLANSNNNNSNEQTTTLIRLQLWDTPGRERLDAKRERQHQQQPSLSESFLEQADAYMLIYDVTSSTSFKQLLKWYADLLKLNKSPLPILIVGTKVDLLDREQNETRQPHGKPQRSVLRLQNAWRGLNYQYEYQVSKIEQENDRQKGEKRMEIASYLADRDNWTTDWGYLEGLWSSEDASHPDRDMVVLWCGRNDLQHIEASAATGQGVEEAIRELVILALEAKTKTGPEPQSPPSTQTDNSQLQSALKYNKALDLHQRYAPKDEMCCHSRMLGLLLRNCRK